MRTYTLFMNEEYVDISASAWTSRLFVHGKVAWLAFDDHGCNNRLKIGYINMTRVERWKTSTWPS
jgi:hypothetical protein